MSARKRKLVTKKLPTFRSTRVEEPEDNDLKKVKANAIKALEEKEEDKKEWLDKELDKNLKKQ